MGYTERCKFCTELEAAVQLTEPVPGYSIGFKSTLVKVLYPVDGSLSKKTCYGIHKLRFCPSCGRQLRPSDFRKK